MDLEISKPALNHTRRLQEAGLRPTRQRVRICEQLFNGKDRHFTAEELFNELNHSAQGESLSLATIYNTLKGFTEVGLLSTLTVDSGKLYYDTNTSHHYHVYDASGRCLADLDTTSMKVQGIPDLPEGHEIDRIDIIVRTKPKA
jgi:Fur family iron response transcriptional regulator